jgi:hypothetical protein
MSALSIQPTYPIFTETDGQPLEDGYIWIGQTNLDPQVNPINVYFDAALTIPAGQPIRTLGGYPSNSGTPARLYVNSDYSIRVMNKNGNTVCSAPAATERYNQVVFGANAEQVDYDPPFANAVRTNVEAKLSEIVSVTDFGAVGDGVTDDTTAIKNAIAAVATAAVVVGGQKQLMNTVYFPPGNYLITEKKALSAAFSSGIFAGVSFVGAGRAQTRITYSSSDPSADNYLFSSSNSNTVRFENLELYSTNSALRGIEWRGAPGPTGSYLAMIECRVSGSWTAFFEVTGSVLGSETYWENCNGSAGYASGTFFSITSTNPQSVNHTFVNCTLGGLGTIFKLRAGGNIRVYGGYTSLFEGATYFDADADGTKIGSGNNNMLFDGVNFEDTSTVVSCTIVKNYSSAAVNFRNCNFFSVTPSGTDPLFVVGLAGLQRSGELIFDKCFYPLKKSVFEGGVVVRYLNCVGIGDWQNSLTLVRSTTSNFLQPYIEIDGCVNANSAYPLNPVDCYPGLLINDYETYPTATMCRIGIKPKHWVARSGNTNTGNGLFTGFNNTYTSFTVKIPLGAVLRRVWLFYVKNNGVSTADRQFKIENSTGSVTFIPETTISPSTSPALLESNSLFYMTTTEAEREIVIYGRMNAASIATGIDDYGYVLLEYI